VNNFAAAYSGTGEQLATAETRLFEHLRCVSGGATEGVAGVDAVGEVALE
jgi:hypothetical protein